MQKVLLAKTKDPKINDIFGKWKILDIGYRTMNGEFTKDRASADNGRGYLLCECQGCGRVAPVDRYRLKRGNSNACTSCSRSMSPEEITRRRGEVLELVESEVVASLADLEDWLELSRGSTGAYLQRLGFPGDFLRSRKVSDFAKIPPDDQRKAIIEALESKGGSEIFGQQDLKRELGLGSRSINYYLDRLGLKWMDLKKKYITRRGEDVLPVSRGSNPSSIAGNWLSIASGWRIRIGDPGDLGVDAGNSEVLSIAKEMEWAIAESDFRMMTTSDGELLHDTILVMGKGGSFNDLCSFYPGIPDEAKIVFVRASRRLEN